MKIPFEVEIGILKQQLAEARAEIERLKSLIPTPHAKNDILRTDL